MITPHPHQVAMLDEARQALFEHEAIILQSPTGSGKTVMGTLIGQGAQAKGRRVMFTVHRDFLVDQTSATFLNVGLEHGIIAAGYTANPRERVQIASIDTLKHRLDKVARPDLLVVDEGHHSVAAGWLAIIDRWRTEGTRVIALTATPCRLDGRGLAEAGYTYMVRGPSVRWLIDNGFLCDYEAYAPSLIDMSGVHSRMGDFIKSEAEDLVDKPTITGDAIREYSRLTPGRRAVAFCISVKHSEHVCAQFNAAGIPAAHIDSSTQKADRQRLLNKFRAGEILVLSAVDIFGEGFDLPAVETAILLRPTQSLSLHLQQIGRALRTSPGKDKATILDHVGNLTRLGLPDSDFEWSLEGREKRRGKKKDEPAIPIRQCVSCYAVFPPAPVCPRCGAEQPMMAREVTEVEGELQKIDREALRAQKAAEREAAKLEKAAAREVAKRESQSRRISVARAKTLEELQAIGEARGYQPTWAHSVWLAKERGAQARAEAQAKAFLKGFQ